MNPDLPPGALTKPKRGSAILARAADDAARKKRRNRVKRRKTRAKAEAPVKAKVRAECVERDGPCLVWTRIGLFGECRGPSVWSHLRGHRRSNTRGMAPEKRHNTMFSAILCSYHDRLEESGRYEVVFHTIDYANGRVSWQPRQTKAA